MQCDVINKSDLIGCTVQELSLKLNRTECFPAVQGLFKHPWRDRQTFSKFKIRVNYKCFVPGNIIR